MIILKLVICSIDFKKVILLIYFNSDPKIIILSYYVLIMIVNNLIKLDTLFIIFSNELL